MTTASLDEILAQDDPCPDHDKPTDKTPQATALTTQLQGNQALIDKLASVSTEALYQNDRAQNRLRWLAFYYLSKRELSRYELEQKLLNKDFSLDVITPLLDEFAKEGYQSDRRFAQMLVRESIRKSRGKRHISHALKKAKVCLDMTVDELIDSATADTFDETILADITDGGVDWLLLAVEARCKKYGNDIPTDPKHKARQLRFLQYRGFAMDVCFEALKRTLDDF